MRTTCRFLQNQALAQDAQAFRLAVRLYRGADGDVAEVFGVLIGRVVRAQPTFFLQQVKALGFHCSVLEWPIQSPGLEYVDRPEASEHEIEQRIAGLRAVRRSSLASVKKQCLNVLGAGG